MAVSNAGLLPAGCPLGSCFQCGLYKAATQVLLMQEAYRPDNPAGSGGVGSGSNSGASLPEPGASAPPRLPAAAPAARDSLAVLLEVRALCVCWPGGSAAVCPAECKLHLQPHVWLLFCHG